MVICCLLTCALAVGQADRSEWKLAPALFPGLELVYSGTYTEEALIPGVQFQRTYRLETTLLVLEAHPDFWEVAILTALRLQRQAKAEAGQATSVRLEVGRVDRQGKWSSPEGGNLSVPLAGPPTLETGAIVELPRFAVSRNRTWLAAEKGRPPMSWEVLGPEHCGGTTCVKITGQQQSGDWSYPRADHTAWRRKDTVWLGPQLGVAYRVERVIERRDPARRDPSQRLVVRYDLDSRLRYPGSLFEYRADEIRKTLKFREAASPLWNQPVLYQGQIDVLLRKIAFHLDNRPEPTPYRQALLQVKTRLERARRGEVAADLPPEEPMPIIPLARLGQRAPDFMVTDLINNRTERLHRLLGRPVLIIFFNPATASGKQVLQYGQAWYDKYRPHLAVLPMAASDDVAMVRRLHAELQLPFTVLDGQGLHHTFGVDATPRFILLDADGVVRGTYTGWGYQVPGEIENEIRNWLPR